MKSAIRLGLTVLAMYVLIVIVDILLGRTIDINRVIMQAACMPILAVFLFLYTNRLVERALEQETHYPPTQSEQTDFSPAAEHFASRKTKDEKKLDS